MYKASAALLPTPVAVSNKDRPNKTTTHTSPRKKHIFYEEKSYRCHAARHLKDTYDAH